METRVSPLHPTHAIQKGGRAIDSCCVLVRINQYDGSTYILSLISCLLYTSDAADEGLGVDLGGRRIIKKKIENKDFFFQAEDGIRDFCLSRGLGDVYKRQPFISRVKLTKHTPVSYTHLTLPTKA